MQAGAQEIGQVGGEGEGGRPEGSVGAWGGSGTLLSPRVLRKALPLLLAPGGNCSSHTHQDLAIGLRHRFCPLSLRVSIQKRGV